MVSLAAFCGSGEWRKFENYIWAKTRAPFKIELKYFLMHFFQQSKHKHKNHYCNFIVNHLCLFGDALPVQ